MWVLGWMHDVNVWIRVLRCGAGSGVLACCELGRVDFPLCKGDPPLKMEVLYDHGRVAMLGDPPLKIKVLYDHGRVAPTQ